nr:hypothetical protein [Tanacetum cinerariifolium]
AAGDVGGSVVFHVSAVVMVALGCGVVKWRGSGGAAAGAAVDSSRGGGAWCCMSWIG